MLKSLKWTQDRVLTIKVDEGVFTLAQMRTNHLLEVFDTFRADEHWPATDLNASPILFCIFVASSHLKSVFSSQAPGDSVTRNQRPVGKRMLSAIFGQPGEMGADLIDLSERYSNIDADIIKPDLSAAHDLEIIHRYELSGMLGDPVKFLARLRRYHTTGVNWDESKEFLFPGIPLPAPSNSALK